MTCIYPVLVSASFINRVDNKVFVNQLAVFNKLGNRRDKMFKPLVRIKRESSLNDCALVLV